MFTAQSYSDPAEFEAAIASLVRRDPVGATMVSHVLAGHLARSYPGGDPLMIALHDGADIAAAAVRFHRHPVLVVLDPDGPDVADLVGTLVQALHESGEPVSGFHGRRPVAQLLAQSWTRQVGIDCGLRMATLFYRLGSLAQPVGVPGAAREAVLTDDADVDLLAGWFAEFGRETGVTRGESAPDRSTVLEPAQRGQRTVLWCVDRAPVACASHSAVRNGGARIAPVYTPPEHRRKGYGASATTAAVQSARALGAAEITLFADAEYPPANAVYRGLGFEVIAEFAEMECPPAKL